jgi:RsiW-degrading membrane proteinase PrsW (M82 family)
MILLLLILSIAPVVFFGHMIYKRDFDKEPTGILVKLFICGVLSTILTLLLTLILYKVIPFFATDQEQLNLFELAISIFIGVALIEEFSKWIFVYKLEYNDQEFNHLYDGIVYAAFVALGFACFENILYVMQGGVGTAIMRAFLAIPGHLCDGIMMGYYLSMAKLAKINGNDKLSKKNLVFSLLVPVIAHGIYDYLIFASSINKDLSGIFMILFFVFVVLFFIYASKKVKQLSNNFYNLNPGYVGVRYRQQGVMYPQYNYQVQPNYNNYPNQGYGQQPIYYNNQPSYPQQTNYNPGYNQGYAQQTGYQQPNYQQNAQPINQTGVKFCGGCGQPVTGRFCGYCGRDNQQ